MELKNEIMVFSEAVTMKVNEMPQVFLFALRSLTIY